jgi:prepilin-type processing-associated H-X9-DG protein
VVALGLVLVAGQGSSTASADEARDRATSVNNLKQLALAVIVYADSHKGRMPAHAIYSKDGKPLLSWRVAILPYIEQQQLYQQFKLDEPWDSENNKKLLDQMPKIYAPLGVKTKDGHSTFYQVFHGKMAAFEGKEGMRFPASFTDGTSNTLLVVEAGEAVPWSKPADVDFDPAKPLPKLGGLFPKGFNTAFADGSVRFIKKGVDEKTLKALITRNGGEVVNIP